MAANTGGKSKHPGTVNGPAAPAGPDKLVESMARTIRQLFVVHYRTYKYSVEGVESDWGSRPIAKWDGGDSDTATHQPVWPQVARRCLDEEIDPAGFVAAQFINRDPNHKPPMPNALLGAAALKNYRSFAEKAPHRLREALAANDSAFKMEVRWREMDRGLALDDAARSVLRDRSFGASPIYRFCLACKTGEAAIAAQFLDGALQQYVFQRHAYDATWGEFIPAALRQAADDFSSKIK